MVKHVFHSCIYQSNEAYKLEVEQMMAIKTKVELQVFKAHDSTTFHFYYSLIVTRTALQCSSVNEFVKRSSKYCKCKPLVSVAILQGRGGCGSIRSAKDPAA